MKTLYLFIISLVTIDACAQSFAPQGATWHYNLVTWNVPSINIPIVYSVTGNQVINGINCTIIQEDNNSPGGCVDNTQNSVYFSGNVVYRYLPPSNSFSVLYDFNATAGSSYSVGSTITGPITVFVDSVSTIIINGQSKIIQYVHNSAPSASSNLEFNGPIIEGIGSTTSLFPVIATCDPAIRGLRCYEDNNLGLYNTFMAPSCSTIYITSGINSIEAENVFSFFPNPCIGSCKFVLTNRNNENAQLVIRNLLGKEVTVYDLPQSEIQFDVTNMSSGVYLCAIQSKNHYSTYKKLVVY